MTVGLYFLIRKDITQMERWSSMGNNGNLIPNENRTPEERRENARKAGIASGIARRQKKTLREIGEMIGSLDIKSEKNREILRQAGIDDEDMINDVGMLFRLNLKAQQGDPKAIELLAKLRGQLKNEEPLANINIQSVNISFGNKKVIDGEVSER